MRNHTVAVVHGDGIGPEVCQSAIEVVRHALGNASAIDFVEYPAGAGHYRDTGDAFPEATYEGCKQAHAVLHGAAGLPDVTYPDGTEPGIEFGLQLRFRLDLYANVRPIRIHPGVESPLRAGEPGRIDYVILRENTEGLYAARGGGNVLRNEIASDTMLITRKGSERIFRYAFGLSRRRNGAPLDGRKRVTVCDKANVLRSYAFFRRIFNEVAREFPDIETDYAYADAMTAHLVKRPAFYDVIVAENMFGDIISDLGAATVGSMGMSPTAELGEEHGFFQAAHGSAPDIAGKGIANPVGTILAGAMMLDWLAERRGDADLAAAARRIDRAVEAALRSGQALTRDVGGTAGTTDATRAIIAALR